jgi:hypothetical protein
MSSDARPEAPFAVGSSTSEDVAAILGKRGWLSSENATAESQTALQTWFARAAELLGPHAAGRAALEDLLALVFGYDAGAILSQPANQAVLVRDGARDVIRELANRVLPGGDVDSVRLKEIVDGMKSALPYRSRDMFHPIRVALAGAAGNGELDRVILLLDAAAKLPFAAPVKGTRQRMLEFCAALD